MAKREIKNIDASILEKLKNYSEKRKEDRNLTLSNYAIERFLYRLSISRYASQFTLKGAQLLRLWHEIPYRATRDLDLLRYGSPNIQELTDIFKDICDIKTDISDGIRFLADTVKAEVIREESVYDGIRIKLEYRIGKTGQFMQIDIGFGDAVISSTTEEVFPSILDMPGIKIKAYPRESVIAEKVEAMVILGIANSRMKDFFDVFKLSEDFEFDGKILSNAIKATFERRQTAIPTSAPLAFTDDFATDQFKTTQWNAFLRKHQQDNAYNLERVIQRICSFIMPLFEAIVSDAKFQKQWNSRQGWT